MDKKIAIGLYFSYNENWIGGAYYIINIIRTLNFLEDSQKPKLYILLNKKEDFEILKDIKYPYIEKIVLKTTLPIWRRGTNKISRFVFNKEMYIPKNNFDFIDILFPANTNKIFNKVKNKLFWIPDFQEKHLPQFFTEAEIDIRYNNQLLISQQDHLLFSSINAKNDFDTYFPDSKIAEYVYQFTSILERNSDLILEEVLTKYNLSNEKYFFSPNQFWKHKNQIIILKALRNLKRKDQLDFNVYFSGKENDFRNPDYFQEILLFVRENQLEKNVKFLGFIDRKDQLCLMDNAMAIIQPSLFEGWSTVVEDAKAMNQNCIVSDIAVHREQLKEQAYFFDPNDEEALIQKMLEVIEINKKRFDFDYNKVINDNAANFLNIMNKIILNQ